MNVKPEDCPLSVIIPVHNAAAYLSACLESVLGQDVPGMEVWAVDDASTDGSAGILKRFAQEHRELHVLTFPENLGVSAARNAGMERAAGTYLAFCDADDTVPPGAYRNLLGTAKHGAYDVVLGAHEDCNDDGHILFRPLGTVDLALEQFLQNSAVWERIYRRVFLENHAIRFRAFLVGEDVVFNTLVYRMHPKVGNCKVSVYRYWTHNHGFGHSISNQPTAAYFRERLRCYSELILLLKDTDGDDAMRYVSSRQLPYLRWKFLQIFDGTEAEPAFAELKTFLGRLDWKLAPPDTFEKVFGLPWERFQLLTALQYRDLCADVEKSGLLPRDFILEEFRKGQIGLRYIGAYLSAWLRYKLSHHKESNP
jgi:glycosyltransferase involved in cell wall biosynthesis